MSVRKHLEEIGDEQIVPQSRDAGRPRPVLSHGKMLPDARGPSGLPGAKCSQSDPPRYIAESVSSQNQDERTDVFATTQWSLIVDARSGSRTAMQSLEELCGGYWTPLYRYVLRHCGSEKKRAI
jgi:hypothetical protein